MISIIICSTKSILNEALRNNIIKTIGVPHEIIHIDNSQGKYNIFEAYNLGVKQAKGEYLCFMHEDIIFHSQNWGKAVELHLSQPFVGALGVAGGNVVLDKLDWRFYGFGQVYLIQGNSSTEETPGYYISHTVSKDPHIPLSQVAVLDGVWICIRKDLFNQIRFDDHNFHDFHLYDSDICMQVNQMGLGVFVTYDVLLEHKSEGTFSEGYKDSLAVFANKWKDCLPLIKGMVVSNEQINEALTKAQIMFDKRLAHDAIIIRLRKFFNAKRNGEQCPELTDEEIQVLDESAFSYRKICIKNKELTNSDVWPLICQYMKSPYAKRKAKLLTKYVWYRVIR